MVAEVSDRRLTRLAVSGLLVAVSLLGACGGDDDADGAERETTTTDAGPENTARDQPAQASAAFCEQADTVANDDSLDELDINDAVDAAVVEQLFQDWAEEAPDGVRGDIETVAEQFAELAQAVVDAREADDPEAAQEELEEQFADFEAATERVEEFVSDACDIDLSGDG